MKQVPLKQGETMLYAVAQRRAGAVTLLTWKKDRSVSVSASETEITLVESGYEHLEKTFTSPHDLKPALREACRREFPRSNRLYVAQDT